MAKSFFKQCFYLKQSNVHFNLNTINQPHNYKGTKFVFVKEAYVHPRQQEEYIETLVYNIISFWGSQLTQEVKTFILYIKYQKEN